MLTRRAAALALGGDTQGARRKGSPPQIGSWPSSRLTAIRHAPITVGVPQPRPCNLARPRRRLEHHGTMVARARTGLWSAVLLLSVGCQRANVPPGPLPTSPSGPSANGPATLWDSVHYAKDSTLNNAGAIRVTIADGDYVRAQVPGYPDYFMGRKVLRNTDETWSYGLVLRKMDWDRHTLALDHVVFKADPYPYALGDSNRIGGGLGAYDPDIISFNGELWVAFECVHLGFLWSNHETIFIEPIYSVCMGALDLVHGIGTATLTRTYVAVEGQRGPNGNYYSASVPRLLAYQGRAYLYWTAAQYQPAPSHKWINLTIRGTELKINQYHQLMPMRANGSFGSVHSSSSAETTEVWGLNANDPSSNVTADGYQMMTDGTWIYAVGALGGDGGTSGTITCLTPDGLSSGCYRLSIARSKQPLAVDTFNADILPSVQLPSNPVSYGFFFRDPHGTYLFMAGFGKAGGQPPRPENVLNVLPFNVNGATATTLAFSLTSTDKPICGTLGGTRCEWNGNKACSGLGQPSSDCVACCGGTVTGTEGCGTVGGNTCEWNGNGACGGLGAPTKDCDFCCVR